MTLKKKILMALAALGLALGAAFAVSAPAQASTGGVNIQGWCANANPARPTTPGWSAQAGAKLYDAYSWVCIYTSSRVPKPPDIRTGVDMNAACAYTYPGHPGDARLGNAYNAYSWYCVY